MSTSPVVSVVIPVYNDVEGVRTTLDSLTNQRNPPSYEVLVVDNDSTDNTPKVIEEFEAKYSKLIFGLSETDIQSSYAARNTGIEHSSGEIVAFLDADMSVEKTWVVDIKQAFDESNVQYLGYNVEMYILPGEDTLWARHDVAMGLPIGHYIETKQFAPTCALAVRSEVFDEVGRFDETLVSGGDKEFGNRVHDAGLTMGYIDDIVVRHPARSTFRAHVKKAARIGRGQLQLWRDHDLAPHPLSPVRFLPPSPSRVRNRMQNRGTFSLTYLNAYLLKSVQTLSSLRCWWLLQFNTDNSGT